MHIDDFSNAMHDRFKMSHEIVSPSYRASLQIDWVPESTQPEVDVVLSSSNKSDDEYE